MSTGPKNFRRGTPLTARSINEGIVGGVLNSGAIKTAGGKGIAHTVTRAGAVNYDSRTLINPAHSSFFRMAQIQTVEDDYLGCVFWNIVDESERGTINIAKPYLLQRTPFDGETISYIDSTDVTYAYTSDTEYKRTHNGTTHYVTPNYYIGELIVAFRLPTNVVVGGVFLSWMELALGRYWAQ